MNNNIDYDNMDFNDVVSTYMYHDCALGYPVFEDYPNNG